MYGLRQQKSASVSWTRSRTTNQQQLSDCYIPPAGWDVSCRYVLFLSACSPARLQNATLFFFFYSPTAHPVSADRPWSAYVNVRTLIYKESFDLSELADVSVENVQKNSYIDLSQRAGFSLNNWICFELLEFYKQTAHVYGSFRGKSPFQGSVMGGKASQSKLPNFAELMADAMLMVYRLLK